MFVKRGTVLTPEAAKRRLRRALLLFLILLGIPLALLFQKIFAQLEGENFLSYFETSQSTYSRIESTFIELLAEEDRRPADDYEFLGRDGTFSPLAASTTGSTIPGTIGFFQIDPQGNVSVPFLPSPAILREHPEFKSFVTDQGRQLAEQLTQYVTTTPLRTAYLSTQPARSLRDKFASQFSPGQSRANERDTLSSITALLERPMDKVSRSRSESPMAGAKPGAEPKDAQELQANEGKTGADTALEQDRLSKRRLSELNIDARQYETQRFDTDDFLRQKNELSNLKQKAAKKVVGYNKEQAKTPAVALAGAGRNYPSNAALPQRLGEREEKSNKDSGNAGMSTDSNLPITVERVEENRAADEEFATQPQDQKGAIIEKSIEKLEASVDDVEPLRVVRNGAGQLIFYRTAFLRDARNLQGFVVDENTFFREIIDPIRSTSSLSGELYLVLGYGGDIVSRFSAEESAPKRKTESLSVVHSLASAGQDTLLFRSFLPSPLQRFELLFTAKSVGIGPGGRAVEFLLITILVILPVGMFGIYQIGARQIDLAKERSDFVSAVSHELRTPLTSIRMYSEMLREGWIDDESKKRSYYDFIFFESERLSRLISNILQLSKLFHHSESIKLVAGTPETVLNTISAKVESQTRQAGFNLQITKPNGAPIPAELSYDEDKLVQIFVNLVDNAIKFSGKDARKTIEIGYRYRTEPKHSFDFFVRDYGPGIPRSQMRKIFTLFYRGGDELTRTTPGTGIGLALVHELAQRMHASIDVKNCEPGAEFIVSFPATEQHDNRIAS